MATGRGHAEMGMGRRGVRVQKWDGEACRRWRRGDKERAKVG